MKNSALYAIAGAWILLGCLTSCTSTSTPAASGWERKPGAEEAAAKLCSLLNRTAAVEKYIVAGRKDNGSTSSLISTKTFRYSGAIIDHAGNLCFQAMETDDKSDTDWGNRSSKSTIAVKIPIARMNPISAEDLNSARPKTGTSPTDFSRWQHGSNVWELFLGSQGNREVISEHETLQSFGSTSNSNRMALGFGIRFQTQAAAQEFAKEWNTLQALMTGSRS